MDYTNFDRPAQDRDTNLDALTLEAAAYTLAEEGEIATESDIYIVQPGDTYHGIASTLGITVYEISSLNPYVNPDALRVGQQLVIPQLASASMAPEHTPARDAEALAVNARPQLGMVEAQERPEAVQPESYMHTPQDQGHQHIAEPPAPEAAPTPQPHLSSQCTPGCTQLTLPQGWDCTNIFMRYGISYRALESANPGLSIGSLKPGMALCIPPQGTRGSMGSTRAPSHTIERHDTLDSIARRYRVDIISLFRENPVLAPDDFIAGRMICIPEE